MNFVQGEEGLHFLILERQYFLLKQKPKPSWKSWNESEAGFYFDVLLEDGRFEEEHIYDYQDCMEVIGNTIDNPELLEWAVSILEITENKFEFSGGILW